MLKLGRVSHPFRPAVYTYQLFKVYYKVMTEKIKITEESLLANGFTKISKYCQYEKKEIDNYFDEYFGWLVCKRGNWIYRPINNLSTLTNDSLDLEFSFNLEIEHLILARKIAFICLNIFSKGKDCGISGVNQELGKLEYMGIRHYVIDLDSDNTKANASPHSEVLIWVRGGLIETMLFRVNMFDM